MLLRRCASVSAHPSHEPQGRRPANGRSFDGEGRFFIERDRCGARSPHNGPDACYRFRKEGFLVVTCPCTKVHEHRRIVLTGGPGAGKTALLELISHAFCPHVRVLPEAAGVIFGGGFPREEERESRRAAQRAICHVQRELEVVGDGHNPAVVLCDRGTVDGVAYWPGPPEEFWSISVRHHPGAGAGPVRRGHPPAGAAAGRRLRPSQPAAHRVCRRGCRRRRAHPQGLGRRILGASSSSPRRGSSTRSPTPSRSWLVSCPSAAPATRCLPHPRHPGRVRSDLLAAWAGPWLRRAFVTPPVVWWRAPARRAAMVGPWAQLRNSPSRPHGPLWPRCS